MWREGWHWPEYVETHRGHRVHRTYVRRPGERDWDEVFVVLGWPGIWFNLKAVRDYIEWRVR